MRNTIKLNILFIGVLFLYSCSLNEKSKDREFSQMFFDLDYDYVDTIISTNYDTILSFVFLNEVRSQKIYVSNDLIEHRFGNFDDNNTFWVEQFLSYRPNGEIIDSLSQFTYLNLTDNAAQFQFFAKGNVDFYIKKYGLSYDTSEIELIETIEVSNRKIALENKHLKNHLIFVNYKTYFQNDDNTISFHDIEAPIDRETQIFFQNNIILLNDPRIKNQENN